MPTNSTLDHLRSSATLRRLLRWAVMIVVLALVGWFAGDTLRQGWAKVSTSDVRIRWSWAALAALLYILGLAPMAIFWRRVLGSLGQTPPTLALTRAYYLGHLGKYVPGKALVAVLRTGALVDSGCATRPVVVSVFIETLTFMATGGVMAAVLLATSGDATLWHTLGALSLALLAGLPVAPPVARRLAGRVLAQREGDDGPATELLSRINWRLSAYGIGCATIAWVLIGLSVWATTRAVGAEGVNAIEQLSLWVEAATLPVVAGFLSLVPGGLFVRDALQVELLTQAVAADTALVAAALWRLISVSSEVVTCAILEASRLYRSSLARRDDTP